MKEKKKKFNYKKWIEISSGLLILLVLFIIPVANSYGANIPVKETFVFSSYICLIIGFIYMKLYE